MPAPAPITADMRRGHEQRGRGRVPRAGGSPSRSPPRLRAASGGTPAGAGKSCGPYPDRRSIGTVGSSRRRSSREGRGVQTGRLVRCGSCFEGAARTLCATCASRMRFLGARLSSCSSSSVAECTRETCTEPEAARVSRAQIAQLRAHRLLRRRPERSGRRRRRPGHHLAGVRAPPPYGLAHLLQPLAAGVPGSRPAPRRVGRPPARARAGAGAPRGSRTSARSRSSESR